MSDTQPVFDAIARSLRRLFGTQFAMAALARDGQVEVAAFHGVPGSQELLAHYPFPIDEHDAHRPRRCCAARSSQTCRLARRRGVAADRGARCALRLARRRSAAPMVVGGKVIGAIVDRTARAVPFDDKQVALLRPSPTRR